MADLGGLEGKPGLEGPRGDIAFPVLAGEVEGAKESTSHFISCFDLLVYAVVLL